MKLKTTGFIIAGLGTALLGTVSPATQTQQLNKPATQIQAAEVVKAGEARKEPPKPAPVVQTLAPAPKVAYTAPTPVAAGSAKEFIYMRESGNVPCKINGGAIDCHYTGNRACGIGQALPCSKLRVVCPDLSDYACQDAWFTNYMTNRYGTWENAKAFWLSHRWW